MLSSALKEFIKQHQNDDIHKLAFRASSYPDIDIRSAIIQIQGRQIARKKIPSWYKNEEIIYPPHLSLEQCSSELTARFKSALFKGNSFVDLTGGLGVDFAFLSQQYIESVYVEQQPHLVNIAKHNFRVLRLKNISFIEDNAVDYLAKMRYSDLIYLDPARRKAEGSKAFLLEDCMPDVVKIDGALNEKALKIMIKLSPMLDISQAISLLSHISDIYVISVANECKELLFIKNSKNINLIIHCINIKKEGSYDSYSFTREEEDNLSINYATSIGKYLYEPNSSLMKAGAYKTVTNQYNINKLNINSHLYTSDIYYPDFQGRVFCIDKVSSLSKADLLKNFRGIKQANITVRNFPMSSEALKNRLKLKDGGDCFVFATTLADEKKVLLLCSKS